MAVRGGEAILVTEEAARDRVATLDTEGLVVAVGTGVRATAFDGAPNPWAAHQAWLR